MAWAAVLRTYGDMSEAASLMASIMMGTMMGTRMLDRTRRALARISWLGSCGDMRGLQCSCGRLSALPDLPWVLRPAHLESSLEGGDGQQGQILLLLCIAHQVHVHQLLHLQGKGATSETPNSSQSPKTGKVPDPGMLPGLPKIFLTSMFLQATFFTTAGKRSEAFLPRAII